MGRCIGRHGGFRALAALVLALAAPGVCARTGATAADDIPAKAAGDGAGCGRFAVLMSTQPWPLPNTHLQAARCLAQAGDTGRALTEVRDAIDHPAFREHRALAADPELVPLHQSPEWQALMALASAKSVLPEPMGSGVDIKYMRRHLPSTPAGLLRERVEVVLIVWVAPDATPAQVDVERSSGIAQIDALAVATARTWRYQAASTDGATFGYPMRIPLAFQP